MPEVLEIRNKPGRPPLNKPRNQCVTISLSPMMHQVLKRLGGSAWVQQKIREAIDRDPSQFSDLLSQK